MNVIETKIYFGTPGADTNLLTNPGFETAGAGGDDVFGTWTEAKWGGVIADEGTIVHGGSHAAKLTNGTPYPTLQQTNITVIAEKNYRFSFWTRGDGSNPGKYFIYDVSNSGYIVASSTGITGTTYTQVVFDFVTPASCVLVNVGFQAPNAGSVVYFDDSSLTNLEEVVAVSWTQLTDVMQDPGPTWEAGLPGGGLLDLVADTGILTFHLNNSQWNSASLAGRYSPAHANILANFVEGAPIKVEISVDGGAAVRRFLGTIAFIRPASGAYEFPMVEVECHDWMGYLSTQELGVIIPAATKRSDQALTTALAQFPIQPDSTDFDVGVETYPLVFNTDTPQESMAAFFQKMARNEMGRIYLEGDGTLVFENRDARPLTTTSSFTLNGVMSEVDVTYDRNRIANIVQARIAPYAVDAAATTVLFELQDVVAPEIRPGKTLTLTCQYTDPTTGRPISATDVVNPPTTFKFGSAGDFTLDDLHANITQANTIGGNAAIIKLRNTSSTVTGFLNDLRILGKGIYVYDILTLEQSDFNSIDAGAGERRMQLQLDQIVDLDKAKNYASFVLGQLAEPDANLPRIRFLANQTAALAAAAKTMQVSTRFTLVEAATGLSTDCYINRLRYSQEGQQLWIEILATPASASGTFIWDTSHWDDITDARWGL